MDRKVKMTETENSHIRLLLVEPDPDEAHQILSELNEAEDISFHLSHVTRLKKALSALSHGNIDVVLINPALPDASEADSVAELVTQAPNVPIVLFTSLGEDETAGLRALRAGAQDCLAREDTRPEILVRSLLYAIERQHRLVSTRPLALIDDVTGLYNHLGFKMLGEHYMKLGERGGRGMFLVFGDIDDFTRINDMHGRKEGDRLLREAATIFKTTFRGSDIIARTGDDEFTVLGIPGKSENDITVIARLQEQIAAHNQAGRRAIPLSMVTHMTRIRPKNTMTLDELLLKAAEEVIYMRKAKKKA